MENKYDIKISCGGHFYPTLTHVYMDGEKMDKEIHISGDISLAEVQSIASNLAVSTYYEKLNAQKENRQLGMMPDGVANAFIVSNEGLVCGVSANLEGKEPSFKVYDKEAIMQSGKALYDQSFHR